MPVPIRIKHDIDPAEEIMADCEEWLKDWRIRPYDVLMVVYQRELVQGAKRIQLPGGKELHLADNGKGTLREDTWQGKVGIVMKVGSLAFTDESDHRWQDFKPKKGDWIVVNVGDTFQMDLPNGRRARTIDENMVRAIIPQPDIVW